MRIEQNRLGDLLQQADCATKLSSTASDPGCQNRVGGISRCVAVAGS